MKKTLSALLGASCLLALSSCLKEINLRLPDAPAVSMLVQGKMLADGTRATVSVVVQQLDYFDNRNTRPIDGAKIWLLDDAGHRRQVQSLNSGGNYRLEILRGDPDFPLEQGRQFHIEAQFPNGDLYVSAPETLLPPLRPDSIHFELTERELLDFSGQIARVPFARFGLDTRTALPGGSPARLRWEVEQSYKLTDNLGKLCYCTRALLDENIHILNGQTLTEPQAKNYTLLETQIDYRFAEGYYLIVYQQIMSENALGYFSELQQMLDRRGTIFDPPAGVIRSNITCTNAPENVAHGFFYVAAQDTLRQYVSPGQSGNFSVKCPMPPSNGEAPRPNSCDDCLLEPGGSTQKPSWWKH